MREIREDYREEGCDCYEGQRETQGCVREKDGSGKGVFIGERMRRVGLFGVALLKN